MAVTSFVTPSTGGLPEGASALITQGFSSSGAYTYTPASPLPAGSYLLSASPCETVYAKANGKLEKSNSGKVILKSSEAISSFRFEADQTVDPNNTLDVLHPMPLWWDEHAQTRTDSSSVKYYGSSNGLHYGQRNSRLYKSLDGVNWKNTGINIEGIDYTNEHRNRIFTVGTATVFTESSRLLVSFDGFNTWRIYNHGLGANAYAYGNGALVAAAGATLYYTTNLSTWTFSYNSSGSPRAIIYAGGKFVAASLGVVETSIDGVTWSTSTTSAGSGYVYGGNLAHSGSLYMFINATGGVYTSPDAITWTAGTAFPGGSNARNLVWFNGVFAAIYQGQASYYTSTGSGSWTLVQPTYYVEATATKIFQAWNLNEAGTELHKTGFYNGTSASPYQARTTDLTNWKTFGASEVYPFVSYKFGKTPTAWYFGDGTAGQIYKTTDEGKTWDTWNIYNNTQYNLRGWSYGNGKFIGMGQVSGYTYDVAWTSNDAITWTTGTAQLNSYASFVQGDGDYVYGHNSGSSGYLARIDSTGAMKLCYDGSATTRYFINAIGNIAFYRRNSQLWYIDWSADTPSINQCFTDNGSTALSLASDANRVYYINGVYVLVGFASSTGTVGYVRTGKAFDRFSLNSSNTKSTYYFLGEINDTLYFYGYQGTTTYNTGLPYLMYKMIVKTEGIVNEVVPTGLMLANTQSVFTQKVFDGLTAGTYSGRFNGMTPAANLQKNNSNGSFIGVCFLKPSSGTVFSLYSMATPTYN